MKKWIGSILCMAVFLMFTGCGSSGSPGQKENLSVDRAVNTTASETKESSDSSENIDLDLTTLSSTMVYSEVYNMMVKPEDYVGKTVKMEGLYTFSHDETTDKSYFACVIQDATACCAQGLEFVLTDDYNYPADYPGEGEEISVVGVFDTYQEGEYTFCTLRNAKLVG